MPGEEKNTHNACNVCGFLGANLIREIKKRTQLYEDKCILLDGGILISRRASFTSQNTLSCFSRSHVLFDEYLQKLHVYRNRLYTRHSCGYTAFSDRHL